VRLRFWVHTCALRKGKLQPTLYSLMASDIGSDCDVLECPMGLAPVINAWWEQTWRELADAAAPDEYLVRLEDDVVVNRHIRHNIETWSALKEPDFGLGVLFNSDRIWPPLPQMKNRKPSGALCRMDVDIPGGCGQVLRADRVHAIMDRVSDAQRREGPRAVMFDFGLSRATRYAGYFAYCHEPSLVNCHEGATVSTLGGAPDNNWSDKSYDAEWKRGVHPERR
jgi:hypothetical protein